MFEHTASPALTREVTGLTSDTKYFVRVSTVTTSAGAPTSAITAVTLTADGKPGTGGDGASATPASGADEGETAVGKAPADSEVTLLSIKKPSLKPESAPRLEVDAGENYKVTTKVSRGPSGRKAAVSVQVGDEWVKLGKSVVKKNGEVTLPAIAANTPGEYLVKISIPKKPARYILLVVS